MADSSRELLDTVYSRLGFQEGDLFDAASDPTDCTPADWVNKGDWLALAKKVGAEKVFFVNDYPVIIFAEQPNAATDTWMRLFNSVWCMARPQMLFLARQGELSVFNLTKKPARQGEAAADNDRLLASAKATADVQEKLHAYRREQVESGRLFEDDRFGFDDRADRALVRDLGRVRKSLIRAGLQPGYAHALIGRSIFIRYLEDRRVLDEEYFRTVVKGDADSWAALLDSAKQASIDFGSGQPILYPFILKNKGFTYALFNRLALDFNGDMFPVDYEEEKAVTQSHLTLLHRFLLGTMDDPLFFFAYRFDIIPIELISSIYETFYSLHKKKRRDEGSFYTPSALVDFVLAETLTDDVLVRSPRVLDPACGSGIFLVEAFRRIVRHRVGQERRRLTAAELRSILRDQIAGIDISAEAIRVAAFSLYLAMLHYLEPPSIRKHKRLPCLTFATRPRTTREQHFDILIASDAFSIATTVSSKSVRDRFSSCCADVVVGNPPWGAPPNSPPDELRSDGGLEWCSERTLAVGDRERSQTFLHRTRDLLRPNGRAGLLVSTGVFFKRHKNTRRFREQWLGSITLAKVVNFAAVRDAFFKNPTAADAGTQGAIAPFAAVIFKNTTPPIDAHFAYWSAKETAFVRRVQAVVLNWADVRAARQSQFQRDDALWKVYWWGGHRDHALIQRLRLERSFQQVVDPTGTRMQTGFIEANRASPAGWLRKFKEFPTNAFERYGPLPTDQFVQPPSRVERRRDKCLYQGPRILIKRGIDQDGGGRIVARYETDAFSFRNSIHCAPISDSNDSALQRDSQMAKVILATLWSSLARYYLFLTSGTWGLWHDELHQDVIYQLPIRIPSDTSLLSELVETVDALRALPPEIPHADLFPDGGLPKKERDKKIRSLEARLDRAVFKLFDLTADERDRVSEFCALDLDLFYHGMGSEALRPLDWPDSSCHFGRRENLDSPVLLKSDIAHYLTAFLDLLEPQLESQNGRLRWRIIKPTAASSMLAVLFETETMTSPLADPAHTDYDAWNALLLRLSQSVLLPTKSRRVYIDGLIRVATDSEIAIIKRNEHRLWTRSSARDDAEAIMVMLMQSNHNNTESR